jgi:hypothetical protein
MKNVFVIILVCSSLFIFRSEAFCASDVGVNPDVITVSSGPISWKSAEEGDRFRIVVLLSEVYLDIYIQKIEYGEETCCAKVISTYHVDNDKFEGGKKLFDVSEISWPGYDTVRFKGNSTLYVIEKLDGPVEVRKSKRD